MYTKYFKMNIVVILLSLVFFKTSSLT